MPRRLVTGATDFAEQFAALVAAKRETEADVDAAVASILDEVRRRGDAAVLDYTKRFDRLTLTAQTMRIGAAEIAAAVDACARDTLDALRFAAARIEDYHRRQMPDDLDYVDAVGTRLGARWRSIAAAGLYVPGGTAAYPSSVLMNAIPARVAGVPRIAMVVPSPDGVLNPLVLAAASLAGVTEIYRIGGAQAVGALAYGTATIAAVDKIVGPGNAYVAAAKRRVFGTVGIDMIAGPSEILIIGDGSTDPEWIAMDLFSQAEHDEMAQAILLTPDREYRAAVLAAIERLLPSMPRRAIIETSLASRGALVLVRDLEQACAIANRVAPEHLEISTREPRRWLAHIRHAGSIFLGSFSSEALGDYCAGPNHVLPTSRTARFSSPLGVADFQKRSSVIEVSAVGARTLGATAARLARGEGLVAHARSAELRMAPPAAPEGAA